MNDLNILWDQVVKELYLKMISAHYNAFIRPLKPIKMDHDSLYINAVTTMIKNVVNSKYVEPIQSEIKKITGKDINIVFLDPKDPIYAIVAETDIQDDGQVTILGHEKEKELSPRPGADRGIYNSSLNPRYTFDNFVKGKSKEFDFAVAMRVAEETGTKYNTLFI